MHVLAHLLLVALSLCTLATTLLFLLRQHAVKKAALALVVHFAVFQRFWRVYPFETRW